jgi:branched-chain amino acid transport system permease protein
LPSASRRGWIGLAAIVALAALAVAYPVLVENPFYRYLGTLTVMYMALAMGWNLMGGATGYVSLGHTAFFGLGAYLTGLSVVRLGLPPFPMTIVAGVAVTIFAIGVGYAALRTRGASFVIVTLALVYILGLVAQGWRDVTGGSIGLSLPTIEGFGARDLHVPFYYAFLLLLAVVTASAWWIGRSKFGMGLRAIREDEDKAESLGVDTMRFKVVAFALSAGFVGVGGGLYAYWFRHLDPIFVFDIVIGVNMILMALIGGMRTLWGPILGALLIAPGSELIAARLGETQIHLFATGLLLAVVVLLMPEGIIPSLRQLAVRLRPPAASIREHPAGEEGR